MTEPKRTEISSLGEFGLIQHLTRNHHSKKDATLLGVGDDAALMDAKGEQVVLSTDMMCEGIHFDLSYTPLKHLGYKLVAVNVSDIAAMNAIPKQILVSLGLSNRFSVEAVGEIYAGIYAACESYGVDLVGGDTTSSASGLVLSLTVIGTNPAGQSVKRSGAKAGDVLCVTGDLGGAYVGLQILEREKKEFEANPDMKPRLEEYEYVVMRQLKPEARMDIVHDLKEKGILPHAMIDISDGLASELMHIGTQSNLGLQIFEENIPIDKQSYDTAVEFGLDPVTCALNGGEDYELLMALDPEDYKKLEKHPDIASIGVLNETKEYWLVTKGRQQVPLNAQGWKHF